MRASSRPRPVTDPSGGANLKATLAVETTHPDIVALMRWASLILTVPVVGYSAAPFFLSAWRDLKLRRVGMDVPVALGVGAAFLASCWATFCVTA